MEGEKTKKGFWHNRHSFFQFLIMDQPKDPPSRGPSSGVSNANGGSSGGSGNGINGASGKPAKEQNPTAKIPQVKALTLKDLGPTAAFEGRGDYFSRKSEKQIEQVTARRG